MKRLLIALSGAFFAISAAAGVAPLRQHSISPDADDAHIVRFDPEGPAMMVANRESHAFQVGISVSYPSGVVSTRDLLVAPGEAIPLATLVSPSSDALVVMDGPVSLETVEGARTVPRHRRMTDDDALLVDRVVREPVPFFVSNPSAATLHIEIESDGRIAGADVIGGQTVEFADLFASFPLDATSAVIRSATPGSQWFAGLSSAQPGLRNDATVVTRRRAVKPPPRTNDCDEARSVYESALSEMRQFLLTPLVIPAPPRADYSCDTQDRIKEYARLVVDPEVSRIEVLVDIMTNMEFLGCSSTPPMTDIAPLLDRLRRKEPLLPELGDVPEKHMPILAAMVEIERQIEVRGVGTSDHQLVIQTATNWLQKDQDYFIERIVNQHDYKAVGAVVNLMRALTILSGVDIDTDKLIEALKKAMTFRVKLTFETITTFAGMTIRHKSGGETVVEGVGVLNLAGAPIWFREEPGSAVFQGQTCPYAPGASQESGLYIVLDPCSNPAITFTIEGIIGSAPGTGVWACGFGAAMGSGIEMFIRNAFGISAVGVPLPHIALDDKKIKAPAFQNLTETPVDDVAAGTGTYLNMKTQGQIHVTMTHQPKK